MRSRVWLISSMVLALTACGSSVGTTGGAGGGHAGGGAGGVQGGTGGAAGGEVTGDAGNDAADVADAACPSNACTGQSAGAVVCDAKNVVTCAIDADGCAGEAVTTACATGCASGACCGEDGQACCAGSTCDPSAACDPFKLMCVTCPSNFCQTHGYTKGYYCDPSGSQVRCGLDVFTNCLDASTKQCMTAAACSSATGTCGGCDPNDPCFGWPVGDKLCSGPGISMVTCQQSGSCVVASTPVTCGTECVSGSGCCGGSGDPCCSGQTPSCMNNLACNGGTCG